LKLASVFVFSEFLATASRDDHTARFQRALICAGFLRYFLARAKK